MKTIEKEETPAGVAREPKQAGEALNQEKWRWAEPSVWTDRMLTALKNEREGVEVLTIRDGQMHTLPGLGCSH